MRHNLLKPKMKQLIKNDKSVIAVLLFGSYLKGKEYRDIDLCIVLDKKYSNLEMSKKRPSFLAIAEKIYDIHIFQQLPVYIRKKVLEEGKIIFSKNEDLLYELAFQTVKEFEFYKKIYLMYIDSMQND